MCTFHLYPWCTHGQAENYRQRAKEETSKIAKGITSVLKRETKPRELTKRVQEAEVKSQNTQLAVLSETSIQKAEALDSHSDFFMLNGIDYTLKVDLVNDTTTDKLYSVALEESTSLFDTPNSKTIVCKINLAHPFFTRFDQFKKADNYQPIVAIFKALALAEIMAPNRGTTNPTNIRLLFNNYMLQ